MSRVKHNGEIFTPAYLVNNMLDFVGYTGQAIIRKHIIDNSAGAGAFLVEIVKRYCREAGDSRNLKRELQTYIHGIELEKDNVEQIIARLNAIAAEYGIQNVKWDIKHGSALDIDDYDGKMDFVVGNPPYVRVHNLQDNHKTVKSFKLSNYGMTDLYITFYEISFDMLSPTGRLCLITPSSWLSSLSGKELRRYIDEQRNLIKVIDIGHFQPFENAMTYTFITMFDKTQSTDEVEYYIYDGQKQQPKYVDRLNYADFYHDGRMFFSSRKTLNLLNDINQRAKDITYPGLQVKNGFATLADKIFLGAIDIQDKLVIDTIKASTGKWVKAIFPYNDQAKPLAEKDIQTKHKAVYKYLLSRKADLENRSIERGSQWYLYGRSQAIHDVSQPKLAINTIIKDLNSIKLNHVPAGSGVYSGLYITYDGDFDDIKRLILTDDFVNYVKSLKKYKSGGYYTFSSKDLKNYLLYRIVKDNLITNKKGIYEQRNILANNKQLVPGLS